jgi:hypothetical protein
LAVSEQAEQTSGEPGSLPAEPIAPKPAEAAAAEPVAAPAEPSISAQSPSLVPEQGRTSETPEVKAPEADTASPRPVGKLMIMAPGDRSWAGDAAREAETAKRSGPFGKRRLAAMAAVVALAAVAGALGGALATARFGYPAGDAASMAGNHALESSVARIDTDVAALKASVEHASKMGVSQFNKTSDRLDKLEKAQAEPAAKLARLSEAVEKLHAAPAPSPLAAAAPQAASKDVTGSVTPAAPASAAASKVELARLPTIDDWVLRDVSHGGALIEGRRGVYEVYAGDPVPGLGRIDAIRRQDGRWVVVTSRGLIVER